VGVCFVGLVDLGFEFVHEVFFILVCWFVVVFFCFVFVLVVYCLVFGCLIVCWVMFRVACFLGVCVLVAFRS